MGFLDDMKEAAKAARTIAADDVVVMPAERIDTLVSDLSGTSRRRTDYAGTIWYGGRPQGQGRNTLSCSELSAPVPLPDSHGYEADTAGGVQLQATAAVQGCQAPNASETFQILDVNAALAPRSEPMGSLGVWVTVSALGSLPFGVAYRVVVVCDPAAIR